MNVFSSTKLIFLWLLTLPLFLFSQEQRTVLLTTVGAGTWTVPCGVTSITVEAWGGGGGGGYRQLAGNKKGYGSAGGGGGAYEVSTFGVVPGETLTVEVGKGGSGGSDGTAGGGSWTNVKNGTESLVKRGNLILISAAAGRGALDNTVRNDGTYGAGGLKTTAGGRSGGKGGTAGEKGGGGAGAGHPGGSGGDGGDGTGGTSSLENKLGGAGGLGGQDLNTISGSVGYAFGGGGGGSLKFATTTTANNSPKGGAGASGGIIITYTLPKGYAYCQKSFEGVRPITNVTFAGINQSTLPSSTAQNLEFCTPGLVRAGGIYAISIQGNTGGDNTDYITVFVDWDRSGKLDDTTNKTYRLGIIKNSTGGDGKRLTGIIAVPDSAKVGLTKIRIVKSNKESAKPCATESTEIGQSQDFWLDVQAGEQCPVSVSAPTNLVLQQTGTIINGTFTAPASAPSGYVILRSGTSAAPTPVAGTQFISGTTVGDYYVIRGIDAVGTGTSFSDTTNFGNFYYHVLAFKADCSSGPVFSAALTGTINVCNPASSNNTRYINSVKFTGTLIEDRENSSVYTSPGYHDYRGLGDMAAQLPGGIINMNVRITSTVDTKNTTKVWVDWNRDGIFSDTEKTYDNSSNTGSSSNLLFGFTVPENVPVGLYSVRVRTSGAETAFGPCGTLADGETEDYSIRVVSDCTVRAGSVTAVQTGPGAALITITPVGAAGLVIYEIYDTEFGPLLDSNTFRNTFTINSLQPGVHRFYVKARPPGCESLYRMPVTVIIKPVPEVTFTPDSGEVCGETAGIVVSASVGKEQVTLLQEQFSNTSEEPVQFVGSSEGYTGALATWQLRTGPFTPSASGYSSVRPILTAGFENGQFANIITDVRQQQNIVNHFTTVPTFNTAGFTDLKIDFNLYYFSQLQRVDRSYLELQYSLDGGATWQMLKRYTTDTGAPSRFVQESIELPATFQNQTQLKFRFTAFAFGSATEFAASIAGIDNVRFYGNRDIPQEFSWTGNGGTVFASDCVSPPESGQNICIKPTPADLLEKTLIMLTADAQVASGTNVRGTFEVRNQNRIRLSPGSGEWSESLWKPGNIAPTEDHCVVVRAPLTLLNDNGFARKLTLENGGSITIAPRRSLTVTEAIVNNAAAKDFVVESDANLLQINDLAENRGPITVKRDAYMKRLDYTYWGSPVHGQRLNLFSPATLATRFYVYNESNDLFDVITPTNNFVPGKGYAIRSPNNFPSDNLTYRTFNGVFTGIPNNGSYIAFPLEKAGYGYNLISNPYPSNIDMEKLRELNVGKIAATAYFWTNINKTPAMQGSNYPNGGYENNYAVLNGVGGTPATYVATSVNTNNGAILESYTPTQYIKVGQGFLVKAQNAGESLIFNNSIRTETQDSNFFNNQSGRAVAQKDRFWLQLTTPMGVVSTTLIGYVPDASNDFEVDFDAPVMGVGSDAIYTKLGDKNLQIQGRQFPLDIEDVVAVETNHHSAGIHTISMTIAEGIFGDTQPVFLRDNLTGKHVNLREENYSFTAEAGPISGRFELRYKPEQFLGAGIVKKESLKVYRNGDRFIVASVTKKITKLKVYDAVGRLISAQKPNAVEAHIPADMLADGVYILTIEHSDGTQTRKIIK